MILTHTKEKLHFTRHKNEDLKVDLDRKTVKVHAYSKELAKIKGKC
jgi:hypothetical protein